MNKAYLHCLVYDAKYWPNDKSPNDTAVTATCPSLHDKSHLQDLEATFVIWQPNLNLHLQPPWPQQGFIQHVLPVGHANQQDVVQGVNAINLGQELIDNGVMHPSTTVDTASGHQFHQR